MVKYRLVKKVGKVKVLELPGSTSKEYSDGDSEDVLLKLFESPDAEDRRQKVLAQNPEWRIKYHLAYTRENLLNWYEFPADSKVLEVGAGCGALTGLLAKCCKVDALDISLRRSMINAHRNRDSENVRVIVGNMQDLGDKADYDYVTSIGVLEYSGRFIEKNEPHLFFLKQMQRQLKNGGVLILAIENQLGIKYWSGSREDHTGQLFDSIEDYPNYTGIRTFGRLELEQLLIKAGFNHSDFYYPFPDYKMPIDIYSDDYQPGDDGAISSDLFPTPAPDQQRFYLFAEDLAMGSIAKNKLFSHFANSFLVFARKG